MDDFHYSWILCLRICSLAKICSHYGKQYGSSSKNSEWNYHMTQQSLFWAYDWKTWKYLFTKIYVLLCSILKAILWTFTDIYRVAKKISLVRCILQAEVQQDNTLPSYFCSLTVKKCPICGLFNAKSFVGLFEFYAFCWWFHSLKWDPEVVLTCCPVFPSARGLWCALWRKYVCLINFTESMSYSAIGHEFNINELTIYII